MLRSALLALSVSASAMYPRTEVFDGMPPSRFRAPATMTVETGSVDKCGKAAPGLFFEACVRNNVVHVANPCDYPGEQFARLLCPEQAHLNGWPAEHGA
jgi:hypothetical protein